MNKKYDVIVVGELNVDLIMNKIDGHPEVGKEKIADMMTLTLGSSSAIFAKNLSTLGAKVAFIGKLGNDIFGDLCIENLESGKVDTSMIIREETLATGATIVLNYDQDRAMITHPGAMNHLKFSDISKEMLEQAQHLHFSTCFMQPGIKPNLSDLFELAKSLRLTTSFDAQWDPSEKWDLNLASILPHVDVFLPNKTEALLLTGQSDLNDALEILSKFGNQIIIKLGDEGSLSKSGEQAIKVDPFLNNNVVDAIGAGDSFNAGFIFKYIQGCDTKTCQFFGNLCGAINTTRSGGTTAFKNINIFNQIADEQFGYKN